MQTVVQLRDVQKTYPGSVRPTLAIESFELTRGQQVALRGRSGSGKSTFLNLIAGLTLPDRGEVRLVGQDLARMKEWQRDRWRGQHVGYVFQSFHLLQGLTVWENLWLAAALAGTVDETRLEGSLTRLDLVAQRDRRPGQLSLGQQQRVALARALVHRPQVVLADEPTGNLDQEMAAEALSLLRSMCQECSAALLLVSHDPMVLGQFDQCLLLSDLNRASEGTPC